MESQLREIKPLLEIPDSSYYIFLALVFIGVGVVLITIGLLIKKFWKKRQVDMQKLYFEAFKNLDWSDAKTSAYEATKLGRLLTKDNERAKEIYKQFVPMLETYKYKKEVPAIDEHTLNQYHLLVHIIDESI